MRISCVPVLVLATLACSGGDGPPTGNENPVATVTISGSTGSTIQIGSSQSLTATLRDAQNAVLTGRTIAWSATPTGRVSLSPATGTQTTVQGVAEGSVTVRATSEGKNGEIAFSVIAAGQPPLTASVSMTANQFNPSSVTIRNGGQVTWSNTSAVVHDLTWSSPPQGVSNVDPFNPGTQQTFTFNTNGTFNYQCTKHNGMNGSVTVVAP